MEIFRAFEVEVVKILTRNHLRETVIAAILADANLVSYEDTDAGYFVTGQHQLLPLHRIVCDKPLLIGSTPKVECGFLIFSEDRKLTLECHSWGDESVPGDFREQEISLQTAQ